MVETTVLNIGLGLLSLPLPKKRGKCIVFVSSGVKIPENFFSSSWGVTVSVPLAYLFLGGEGER